MLTVYERLFISHSFGRCNKQTIPRESTSGQSRSPVKSRKALRSRRRRREKCRYREMISVERKEDGAQCARTGNTKESLPYTSRYRETAYKQRRGMSPYVHRPIAFPFLFVPSFKIVKARLTAARLPDDRRFRDDGRALQRPENDPTLYRLKTFPWQPLPAGSSVCQRATCNRASEARTTAKTRELRPQIDFNDCHDMTRQFMVATLQFFYIVYLE